MYTRKSFSLRSAGFLAVLAWALTVLASDARAQRLPQNIRPEHYKLLLTPDLKASTFTGDESIEVMLARPAKAITLNAAYITFKSVKATVARRTFGIGRGDARPREGAGHS